MSGDMNDMFIRGAVGAMALLGGGAAGFTLPHLALKKATPLLRATVSLAGLAGGFYGAGLLMNKINGYS
jgi:hypothetical protein